MTVNKCISLSTTRKALSVDSSTAGKESASALEENKHLPWVSWLWPESWAKKAVSAVQMSLNTKPINLWAEKESEYTQVHLPQILSSCSCVCLMRLWPEIRPCVNRDSPFLLWVKYSPTTHYYCLSFWTSWTCFCTCLIICNCQTFNTKENGV